MTALTVLVALACFSVVICGEPDCPSPSSYSMMETGSIQCGTFSAAPTGTILNASTGSLPRTRIAFSGTAPVPSPTDTWTHQQTHSVVVGAFGKLAFSPSRLDAEIGDTIEFNFLALNHTLTQSEFNDPCNSNGQFDTGFKQFNPRNESGRFLVCFEVRTSAPQWFHCSQTKEVSHCNSGMVFGLNAAGNMGGFIENAISATTVTEGSSFLTNTLTPESLSCAITAATTRSMLVDNTTYALDSGHTLIPTLETPSAGNITVGASSSAAVPSTSLFTGNAIMDAVEYWCFILLILLAIAVD